MKDYYKILDVRRQATEAEIKLAYRNTAKKYHPDLTHNADDVLHLQELNEAYTVLSNPVKRAAYDAELIKAEPRSSAVRHPRPSQTKDTASPHVAEKMKAAMNQYYEEGYVAGYTAAKAEATTSASSLDAKAATLAQENEALRREIKTQITARQEMEQKLLAQEQALKTETEYADELAMRLEWVKDATTTTETAEIPNPLVVSAQKLEQLITQLSQDIDRQKVDTRTIAESIATIAQQERRKQIGEELKELQGEVEKRKKELADIKAIEDKKRAVADLDNYFASMEQRAANWSKKIVADKQLAKSTLYDALDILIWATGQEIDEAYANLMAQYADQQKNPSCAEFLQKARAAYAVLSVPAKRKEYNKSIVYTD
ncbi:MAG: DnaJ domain-containing protein, partial [Clostridiales bacterium]|nr:DnaJ domain-containing protein [Clostridiales bacterium]